MANAVSIETRLRLVEDMDEAEAGRVTAELSLPDPDNEGTIFWDTSEVVVIEDRTDGRLWPEAR